MKNRFSQTALIPLILGLCASLSLAEEPKPQKAKQPAATGVAKPAASSSKAAPPRVEPVDINSASKEELKKVPGIGDAEADKIIAGRPYLSKAHLVTRKIISEALYQQVREQIVAKQKDAKFVTEPKKDAKKDAKK
jgi:DNA uptake protein ComE-like DNA-binding protein